MTGAVGEPLRYLLDAWEQQQARYHADRQSALQAVVSVVVSHCGDHPVVIDLGGGLGSFAARLTLKAPGARVVVVDADLVLLEIANRRDDVPLGAIRTLATDLRDEDWTSIEPPPNGIVSLSTVHYLPGADVARLYRRARRALEPGGLLIVADQIPDHGIDGVIDVDVMSRPGPGEWTWERWWREAGATPELAAAFAARARRPPIPSAEWSADERWHRDQLIAAGFAHAGIVHRMGSAAVLVATT